ncbi:kinase-like domain-containing protein [Mycena maculata]|uniref:Kinase-like domain-containing protein n=1 Tax=Mycena maculata TaxID=230809 RepID=A0AAD7IXP6_9AGAR|nr:kinase-like domain-containing protein [Mycena maculata]
MRYQPFLQERGYMLRPRYRPGWVSDVGTLGRSAWDCEDAIPAPVRSLLCLQGFDVLDATRISDNAQVVLKVVLALSTEAAIAKFLTDETGASNYTIQFLELIPLYDNPEWVFMVMSRMRQCSHTPWFATVREFTEFVDQILEGLVFLHNKNIAHRDICAMNIVMDASRMIPGGFHFLNPTTSDGTNYLRDYHGDDSDSRLVKSRTAVAPVDYYYIDFGLSVRFPSFEARQLVTGDFGRLRKHVPEISATIPYDPFKVDIRLLGEMLRSDFLLTYTGLDFIVPFVKKLRHRNPQRRPDAVEALAVFRTLVSKMSQRKLAEPLEHSFWDKERRAVLFLKGLGRH